jgi:hypothetical protein
MAAVVRAASATKLVPRAIVIDSDRPRMMSWLMSKTDGSKALCFKSHVMLILNYSRNRSRTT